MFMNLNKKFMLVFFFFFAMLIGLFLGFFSAYYDQNIEAEAQSFVDNSARLIDIGYNNNYLVAQVKKAVAENKIAVDEKMQKILDDENNMQNRKIIESFNDIYNKKYDRLQYLLRFLAVGLVWISVSVIILWFLLQFMVLRSVNKLIAVSEEVANGNFAKRVKLNHQIVEDEFSILGKTFNQMLQNIEENILKIKNNQYFLQSIIDAIPDGLRVMDNSGRIILANRAYKELLNVKKCENEYCYKQSMNLKHPCLPNRMLCPLREFAKKNISTFSTIQYFSKEPNRPISISAAKMLLSENGKQNEYIIEAMRDLSHEIKFSHQQKISSLAFLATSIAHEMKNNLGSLRMIMEQIMENDLFAGKKEEIYFKMAYDQIIECIRIPESLLNLAKNTSETSTELSLKEIVEGVCALVDYEAKRKGIEINISIDEKIKLVGNEPDFKMIFLNLCQNAIKAMPDGGALDIDAKISGKTVEISVKDTGIGIEKSVQKRIFEPFFSLSGEKTQGTGLGLSIVKSLVENFKGKIKLTSKKNVGTTFVVTFPMKK